MVEEEYWQEKRLDVKHVLSAWALVLILLAFGLALASLAGSRSCDSLAVFDDQFASALERGRGTRVYDQPTPRCEIASLNRRP